MINKNQDYQNLIEQVVREIKGCAIEVYNTIGIGRDDFTYEACLCRELHYRGLSFIRLKSMPVYYKGERIDDVGAKLQMIVEDLIFVEIDSLDVLNLKENEHIQETLNITYKPVALHINFSVSSSEQMFKRINAQKT